MHFPVLTDSDSLEFGENLMESVLVVIRWGGAAIGAFDKLSIEGYVRFGEFVKYPTF